MRKLTDFKQEIHFKEKPNDEKAHEYFYERLTMFDMIMKYDVLAYGNNDNIELFKELFSVWSFGEHINKLQEQIDKQIDNEKTTTRENEIEIIRRRLERNGF